jgi:hypothetical protein
MRDTLGSLAVLGAVAFTAFGLPLIDRALPPSRPAAVEPFPVGGGVTVMPPPGAEIDVSKTRPGADRGTALFLADGVRLAVVVTPYRGNLDDASSRLHNKLMRAGDAQVGQGGPVRTADDVAGLQGSYSTSGRPGTYAVFVADGRSVEVTASGTDAELRGLGAGIEMVIRSVRFGPPGRGP